MGPIAMLGGLYGALRNCQFPFSAEQGRISQGNPNVSSLGTSPALYNVFTSRAGILR
jgi:hypothetical protein